MFTYLLNPFSQKTKFQNKLVIASAICLIGAVKVGLKFNNEERDIIRLAANWFGSAIFLVILATIVKTFFLQS